MVALITRLIATTTALAFEANTMPAFVQYPGKQSYEPTFPEPQLGDLHRLYSDLPVTCEVKIKNMASSVNPSDKQPNVAPSLELMGHIIGSDVAGVITEVSDNCNRLKVGDKVWGDIGANTHTATGNKTKELGAYGKYAIGLESQLWTIPEDMGFREAASLPKVALTSLKALVWYAGAKNDTLWKNAPTILVLGGSGGTGTTGIQLARAFGGSNAIIITTTSANNSDYCRSLGANTTIDYKLSNWWDTSVVADDSVNVIYDTVGQAGTGDRAMAKIKSGGYYVTIAGALAQRVKSGVQQHMFINSDTNLDSAALLKELTELSEAGHLRMPSIEYTYTLDQIPRAFAMSSTGHVRGKIVIDVENSTAPSNSSSSNLQVM